LNEVRYKYFLPYSVTKIFLAAGNWLKFFFAHGLSFGQFSKKIFYGFFHHLINLAKPVEEGVGRIRTPPEGAAGAVGQ